MFNSILTAPAGPAGGFSSIFFLVIIFVVFYFFLIRPENKRKKKLSEMRSSLSVGDEIVTIGGIMGKIVQATEDTITFETGEDRVRIQVTKWAISTNVREEKAKAQQQQQQSGGSGLFGKKNKAKTSGEDNGVDSGN
ncbi:MAG: preprotein translocase subunit YajC [Oscillospiraceae bacterium]